MKRSSSTGFTIVEVMVVMAVATIIMLAVFVAVPALERNGHNNQRRQDINTLLSALSHYTLANGGNMPSDGTFLQNYQNDFSNYAATSADIHYWPNNPPTPLHAPFPSGTQGIELYFFADSAGASTTLGASFTNTDLGLIIVANRYKCDSNNPGSTTVNGAGYNDVVAVFAVQTATGGATGSSQCEQL